MSAAADRLGGLDVLVNNAGVGVTARLIETPLADYDQVMNVNIRGCLLYAQHAYPHLARRRGCMIHIASDAGIWGEQAIGLYSVTKAAVVMLGKMLALDGGADGVRSNVLCPGDIWPGMRHMGPPGDPDHGEESGGWLLRRSAGSERPRRRCRGGVLRQCGRRVRNRTTLLVDGGMTAATCSANTAPGRRLRQRTSARQQLLSTSSHSRRDRWASTAGRVGDDGCMAEGRGRS